MTIRGILAVVAAITMALGSTTAHADSRHHKKWEKQYKKDRKDDRRAYSKGYRDARRHYAHDNRRNVYRGPTYQGNQRYYDNRRYNNVRYSNARYDDRYWWGNNGRIHCRRDDGTTGLIVGAVAGGTLGNVVAGHGDKLIGSILGGTLGAIVGKEIDKGNARCR